MPSNIFKPGEPDEKEKATESSHHPEHPEHTEHNELDNEQDKPIAHHGAAPEGRPIERTQGTQRKGLRGTAAMDPQTRQEVARKGGLAVSRNRQHMAEIGRKGGQTVSKNREHMAQIGRKGGEASRGRG